MKNQWKQKQPGKPLMPVLSLSTIRPYDTMIPQSHSVAVKTLLKKDTNVRVHLLYRSTLYRSIQLQFYGKRLLFDNGCIHWRSKSLRGPQKVQLGAVPKLIQWSPSGWNFGDDWNFYWNQQKTSSSLIIPWKIPSNSIQSFRHIITLPSFHRISLGRSAGDPPKRSHPPAPRNGGKLRAATPRATPRPAASSPPSPGAKIRRRRPVMTRWHGDTKQPGGRNIHHGWVVKMRGEQKSREISDVCRKQWNTPPKKNGTSSESVSYVGLTKDGRRHLDWCGFRSRKSTVSVFGAPTLHSSGGPYLGLPSGNGSCQWTVNFINMYPCVQRIRFEFFFLCAFSYLVWQVWWFLLCLIRETGVLMP